MTPPSDTLNVRAAAVAGLFYPDDRDELRALVEGLLAAARAKLDGTPLVPRAIIAPHAGYIYSGPIAASAYACLPAVRDWVQRVVIVGPAHRVHLHGLSVSSAQAFATPLGRVPVDRAAVESLLELPFVHLHDDAHAAEHSIEVQLPFLQVALSQFAIVPLAMGDVSAQQVQQVLDALWDWPGTLIVVSSDLSHYHEYGTALALDSATSRAIEALCPQDIQRDQACARPAVQALLALARQRHLRAHTVDQRSSGDTAGSPQRVVGYGAYVFTSPADA